MRPFTRAFDPFSDLFDLRQRLDQALRSPGDRAAASARTRAFPPVNVFRDRDGYQAVLEVPGIPPEDLSIEVAGRTLTISASRAPSEAAGESQHRLERWSGHFSRSLQLPEDADLENLEARCKDGILRIRIHQHEAARPRQIHVTTDS